MERHQEQLPYRKSTFYEYYKKYVRMYKETPVFNHFLILFTYLYFLEEVISRHVSLTESEFDNIAAEWLRYAKQKKDREEKKKEQNKNKQ